MSRTRTKTATLTLRVDPQVKDLLTAAAVADRRSLSNMLEVIVLAYGKQLGIAMGNPQPSARPVAKKKKVPA